MNRCDTCKAWQYTDTDKGECRISAPHVTGWPRTGNQDWCCQWSKREYKPVTSEDTLQQWQIGLNYAYARDYPERAQAWLAAIMDNGVDNIPNVLRPLLTEPHRGAITPPMPDDSDDGHCCEALMQWAEAFPHFCNDADEIDEFASVLISIADEAELVANRAIHASLPANHPWHPDALPVPEDRNACSLTH